MNPDAINRAPHKPAAGLRYAVAHQLATLSLEERRDYIGRMVKNNNAQIGQSGNHKIAIRILGRTASTTMLHVDWKPAVAVKNWIKACLDKDAPEGKA